MRFYLTFSTMILNWLAILKTACDEWKEKKNRIEFTTNCIAISEIPRIKCTDSALKKE